MPWTPSVDADSFAALFIQYLEDAGIRARPSTPPKALYDALIQAYESGGGGGGGGGGAGSVILVPSAKTANFTAAEGYHYRCNANGGTFTATLPAAAAKAGKILSIKNTGASNAVNVAKTGADTIDGATSLALLPGEAALLVAHSTGWDLI